MADHIKRKSSMTPGKCLGPVRDEHGFPVEPTELGDVDVDKVNAYAKVPLWTKKLVLTASWWGRRDTK